MPAQGFSAPIPVPVQGYRPDRSPRDIGPLGLYQSQNWFVRDGIMRTRPGFSQPIGAAFAQRPTGYVYYVHTDGNPRVVMGTTVGWRKFNSGTGNWDDITGAALTGLATDQQVFRVFQKGSTSYLIGCNGSDTPKKWDGSAATYSDVAGTPPKAQAMLVLAGRVILLNLRTAGAGATVSPVGYDVSAFNDFDSGWGSAQFGLLADTPGPIVGGLEFGNLQGAIYKTDAIVMAIAQGALAPFRFEWRVIAPGSGPGSPASVVPITENLHAYLGQDGAVYLFDGVNTRSVGYHVQKHILASADMYALSRAWGFWDFERQELWLGFPEAGSNEVNLLAVVNLAQGTIETTDVSGALWPMRFDPTVLQPVMGAKLRVQSSIGWNGVAGAWQDQTKTYSQFDTQVRRIILGDLITGRNFTDQAQGDGPSAVGIPTFFETGLSDLSGGGSPIAMRWKTIKQIDNYFGQTQTAQLVTVKVGTSEFGEARALTDGQDFDLSQLARRQFTERVTARLLSYRVEATATQELTWWGGEASVAVRGKR